MFDKECVDYKESGKLVTNEYRSLFTFWRCLKINTLHSLQCKSQSRLMFTKDPLRVNVFIIKKYIHLPMAECCVPKQ